MKALVTGLSASKYYSPEYDLTVGVNDCPFPVDHLIVCDAPQVFDVARREVIAKHTGQMFTHLTAWNQYRSINQIKLSHNRSDVSDLNGGELYAHSVCSPYIAVVHAFFQGAKEIYLAGVDIARHPKLDNAHNRVKIPHDFKVLSNALRLLGCDLYLHRSTSDGWLNGVLTKSPGYTEAS